MIGTFVQKDLSFTSVPASTVALIRHFQSSLFPRLEGVDKIYSASKTFDDCIHVHILVLIPNVAKRVTQLSGLRVELFLGRVAVYFFRQCHILSPNSDPCIL